MHRRQRHLGRQLALQWLYQIDVGHLPPDEVMAEVPDEEVLDGIDEEGVGFARALARGVIGDRERIDAMLEQYAAGWPLERMAGVERNVLRIAFFEILDMPDIPASVSIDEAVEVAKTFGTEESGKFVNGILGAYMRATRPPPPA
ncbi:MAG TPA: transcription antitermination factor NusB [Armatimonadota bacterium]|nr:transcription antitermination factor NusB [Armatimonadota bacterium]